MRGGHHAMLMGSWWRWQGTQTEAAQGEPANNLSAVARVSGDSGDGTGYLSSGHGIGVEIRKVKERYYFGAALTDYVNKLFSRVSLNDRNRAILFCVFEKLTPRNWVGCCLLTC